MNAGWRERAGTHFDCQKRPARGSWAMVVTSHPLASAAAVESLAHGGNAVDAACAALFALYVVEPMNVGLLGGGTTHIRTPEGRHVVLDGLCTAPAAARADMFEAMPSEAFSFTDVRDRRNSIGVDAFATPGNPAMLEEAVSRFARLPLEALVAPAIRLAVNGFLVTPYLADAIAMEADDIARDPHMAAIFLPGGEPLRAGTLLVQRGLAEALRLIVQEGIQTLRGGELGRAVADYVTGAGGHVTLQDIASYRVMTRDALMGTYRGHQIVGPPPPSSSTVHIVQMLNILENFDVARLGFGTPESLHLIAEVLKVAFADRVAVADPAFADVPVEHLTSKNYARERRSHLDIDRARSWAPGVDEDEGPNTTHVTVADGDGWVVSATHTIGPGFFGAKTLVPKLGLILNDYMSDFDPRPHRAQSVAPGKRLTSSQSPMIVCRNGEPSFAFGLPGGLRIFGSALQIILNLLDHGMALQEAVEAPRIWTRGYDVEVEPAIPALVIAELLERGHQVVQVPGVAGGATALRFMPDGQIDGAACWRADGTPAGLGGGLARASR